MRKYFLLLLLSVVACSSAYDKQNDLTMPQESGVIDANMTEDEAKKLLESIVRKYNQPDVVVRHASTQGVSYKYKNVSVAKIAPIATEFCEKINKKSYLKEVIQDPLNYRVATFNCL